MAAADYRLKTDATGQREASAQERIATALEGMSVDRAAKTDLTTIIATGTTNTTGTTITAGTYFYLNGALVRAKADIGSGATFTNGTNYEVVTAGALNAIFDRIGEQINGTINEVTCPNAGATTNIGAITLPRGDWMIYASGWSPLGSTSNDVTYLNCYFTSVTNTRLVLLVTCRNVVNASETIYLSATNWESQPITTSTTGFNFFAVRIK